MSDDADVGTKAVLTGAVLFGGVAGVLWAALPSAVSLSPEERARIDAIERSVDYSGCNEVRAIGKAPLYAGQPGYRSGMDGDGDGIACEPIRTS